MDEEFVFKHPNIIQRDFKNYVGYVDVEDQMYKLQLNLPNYPELSNVKLQIFNGIVSVDTSDFSSNILRKSLCELLDDCRSFIKSKHVSQVTEPFANNETATKWENVLNQIKKVMSADCKLEAKSDLSSIKVLNIHGSELHFMHLQLTDKNLFNVIEHSLPLPLFTTSETIEQHLLAFERGLELTEDFYLNLHTIDELCYVVDPNPVTTKQTYRIFKFSSKVFIRVDVNPLNASAVTVHPIGPTDEIEALRNQYMEKSNDWDIDADLHDNLLRIFDVLYFPSEADMEAVRCSICYMYALENQVPIVSCDNDRCGLMFHYACLREWFATLTKTKTFLTVTMGSCPCKASLSASFEHLNQD